MALNRYTLYVGQIVAIDHAKVGGRVVVKITKVNPKNVKTVTSTGQPWNVHPSFLSEATEQEKEDYESAVPVEATMPLTLGAVVRFKAHATEKHALVVLSSHGGGYRLTRLGGDGNRCYTGIAPEQVEVLDINLALEEV